MAHPARHLFSLAGISVAALIIAGTLLATSFYAGVLPTSSQLSAVITATLVDLANEDRSNENLPPLTINPVLVAAAQAKANDMADKGYFAHTSPEGLTSWHWFREVGYSYTHAGENLAVNFSDSRNVEDAWMDSPTHRANIMNERYTEIGIATAVGTYKGKKTTFVVQMFGTPRAARGAEAPREPRQIEATAPVEPTDMATAQEVPPETVVLGSETVAYTSPVERILVSPKTLLHILYVACALVVIAALTLATRLEFRKHHTRHVAAAGLLLMILLVCFVAADRVIFAPPIIN